MGFIMGFAQIDNRKGNDIMHPRGYCCGYHATEIKKAYQLVIMHEDGQTYFVGKLYDWNGIQEAVKEIRELYAKHEVTHHVGWREV